jgi:hypothetical protein
MLSSGYGYMKSSLSRLTCPNTEHEFLARDSRCPCSMRAKPMLAPRKKWIPKWKFKTADLQSDNLVRQKSSWQ